jgi:hypothetical protein
MVVTVTPDKDRLNTPDHKLVPVNFLIRVQGVDSKGLSYRILSVSSNEKLNGAGDGDRSPDWVFDSGPNSIFTQVTVPSYSITESVRLPSYGWSPLGQYRQCVHLRAERSGSGNGRTYTVRVEVRDASGNIGTGTATVFVPKNGSPDGESKDRD